MIIPLDEGWAQLKSGGIEPIEEYLETGVTRYPGRSVLTAGQTMALYSLVHNMCTSRAGANYSGQLYVKHGQTIETYVKKVAGSLRNKTGLDLLKAMKFRWENHVVYNKWMQLIFQYLDDHFVRSYPVDPLRKKGLLIFYEHAFLGQEAAVRDQLLQFIEAERNGNEIDRELCRCLVGMYIDLGDAAPDVYQKHFENRLLLATQYYYSNKAEAWLSTGTFAEYLRKVDQALLDEEKRSKAYLDGSTFPKLSSVLQRTLLKDRMESLLAMDGGILSLLENQRIEDLQRLYRLFGLLDNGHQPVADRFRTYVYSRGIALVDQHSAALDAGVEEAKDQKSVKVLIQKQLQNLSIPQDFLNLHDEIKDLSLRCFQQDLPFQRAMKDACEDFMNKTIGTHTIAAFLSTFCDHLLRSRCSTGILVEQTLTKVISLFTYLNDKDLFVDIYRNQLARRLLTETSASIEAEKLMISKLKFTCGAQFTSQLEGMLTDLSTACEVQRNFKAEMMNSLKADYRVPAPLCDNFSVMVLTSGNWPSYQTPEVNLPHEMQACANAFHDWYINKKTSHRKLSWVHHLGQAVITSRFPNGGVYDIQCNTLQACLLLLFNNETVLSTSVIRDALGLDELLVKKLIICFTVAKILVKAKSEDGDEFQVNDSLVSKLRLIKVPTPAQEETHNRDKVEDDRSISIEAAIVRIMKARKTLRHTDLVVEVLNQLTLFKPNPRIVKSKIESLIDREFLARSSEDHQTYVYVA